MRETRREGPHAKPLSLLYHLSSTLFLFVFSTFLFLFFLISLLSYFFLRSKSCRNSTEQHLKTITSFLSWILLVFSWREGERKERKREDSVRDRNPNTKEPQLWRQNEILQKTDFHTQFHSSLSLHNDGHNLCYTTLLTKRDLTNLPPAYEVTPEGGIL
jgi:hypothetical protein